MRTKALLIPALLLLVLLTLILTGCSGGNIPTPSETTTPTVDTETVDVPPAFMGRIDAMYAGWVIKYGVDEKNTGSAAASYSPQLKTWFVAIQSYYTRDPSDKHTSVWAVSDMTSATADIKSVDHWAYSTGLHNPAPESWVHDPAAYAAWRAVETDPYVYLK